MVETAVELIDSQRVFGLGFGDSLEAAAVAVVGSIHYTGSDGEGLGRNRTRYDRSVKSLSRRVQHYLPGIEGIVNDLDMVAVMLTRES